MLVKELYQRLEEVNKNITHFKSEKHALLQQAKQERILEINIMHLIDNLMKIKGEKKYEIKINPICVSKSAKGNLQAAKKFIDTRGVGLGVVIRVGGVYILKLPLNDINLVDGRKLIDTLKFKDNTSEMYVPEEVVPNMLLNIQVNDENMLCDDFKQAVMTSVEEKAHELTLRRLQW